MTSKPDIIIFPGDTTTGFSSNLDKLAEKMSGPGVLFLRDTAKLYQSDVVASMAINEEVEKYTTDFDGSSDE